MDGWNFSDSLASAVKDKKSILVCGIDPQIQFFPPRKMPSLQGRTPAQRIEQTMEAVLEFCCEVIRAVHKFVVAVKPNMAFFEQGGSYGMAAFEAVVNNAQAYDLLVIGDGKRNDGGDTAQAYANAYLGKVPVFGKEPGDIEFVASPVNVDALTVTPYIGDACVLPFKERVKETGRGIFCVTKTSFKPNSAVEQLVSAGAMARKVWQEVAHMVGLWGEGTEGQCGLSNVGVVAGATYPDDAVLMREILPNAWFLIPGYGAQGGGAAGAVKGVRKDGLGGIVNSSRGITYSYLNKDGTLRCDPSDCFNMVAAAAKHSRDELVVACKEAGKWPF